VTVVRDPDHPFNLINIDLYRLDESRAHFIEQQRSNFDKSADLLGSVHFHLHDIIKASPVDGAFDLFREHQYAGELHLVAVFNYGLYGYGYSVQLPVGRPVEEQISYSLYPRVEPPDERLVGSRGCHDHIPSFLWSTSLTSFPRCGFQEPRRMTLIPRAVPHPKVSTRGRSSILNLDRISCFPCWRAVDTLQSACRTWFWKTNW